MRLSARWALALSHAGSDGVAEHWAVVASPVETCKHIGVVRRAYLADVIARIDRHPNSLSTNCCPGTIPPRPPSGTWPENLAYAQAVAGRITGRP